MGKIIPCKWKSKERKIEILTSGKVNFKVKTVIRDKEKHCGMIKISIKEEDTTIVNIYAPNIGPP